MGDRPVRGERRMSDLEALMWHLEKDPHLSSGFAAITILDRAPDLDRLGARLAHAADKIPQLRRRAVATLGRMAPPEWRDDPEFSVQRHLRSVALPAPGGERQLCELAVDFTHTPFDRTRPLWDFLVVEGLSGGRAALLQRLHHTVTDGVGGVRLSEQYLDLDRGEGPRPGGGSGKGSRRDTDATEGARPAASPDGDDAGFLASAAGALTHNLRRNVGAATRTAVGSVDLAVHPNRWPSAARATARTARALVGELSVGERRQSDLWRERSVHFGLELLRLSLADVKETATRLGGTVNDVFVAGAAGGAGEYHRLMGHPVEHLRMAMPVSTRRDRSAAGNAFGVSRLAVPTGPDPLARFTETHARLSKARHEPVVSVLESVAGFVNLLPTSVLAKAARHQVETVDFTTSNVRGAPFDLYVAGAKILANHPIGPLAGTAFNLTTVSYAGSLDMGLHVDLAAVSDPELLHRCIEAAYAELLDTRP